MFKSIVFLINGPSMKRMPPLRSYTFIIGAFIVLCHGLLHTEALAQVSVETVIKAFLNPQFGLKNDAMATAKSGITDILPLLAKDDTIAQKLGFDTAQQIHAASVNEKAPFLVFEVDLRDLQQLPTLLSPGLGERLLRFKNLVLVPITVNTEVKSSLTLRYFGLMTYVGANWQIKRWGSSRLTQVLTEKRKERRASFLVQVPALNRNYLGYLDDQGILQLVNLVKDQYYEAGEEKPAEEVFIKLAHEASTVDESPR